MGCATPRPRSSSTRWERICGKSRNCSATRISARRPCAIPMLAMNRHGRRRKRSVTLWSENAAAGTTHSAHNNDYYCNPSVPLIKHCGNVQKGALLPCCRAFCSTWPPIVGGAGGALTGDSIRFPIPSHRTRLYQDGGGPSVQHNPPRDYEGSVKNRGQSRQILLRFSLLWRADTSVHRPIFCIFAPGI